jgi:hypothetical protein
MARHFTHNPVSRVYNFRPAALSQPALSQEADEFPNEVHQPGQDRCQRRQDGDHSPQADGAFGDGFRARLVLIAESSFDRPPAASFASRPEIEAWPVVGAPGCGREG